MRILVVEDDLFYANAIKELLVDRDLAVECVHTTQDAINADLASFDAAIIDIMLPNNPELSGISSEESRAGVCAGVGVARRILRQSQATRIVLLTSDIVDSEAETWANTHRIPFVRKDDGGAALLRTLDRLGLTSSDRRPLAFIVHGHDETALLELKNYVQNVLQWQEPVVLREQPNRGRTVIEKFEEFGRRVDCVFVLLTPDDKVLGDASDSEKRRSRQNVIFELGFFYGVMGRSSGRILLLHRDTVELPSDIAGIVWIDISKGIRAAGEEIRREVAALIR